MCRNPAIAFAWIGTFFINVAFSTLIAWSSANQWILALIASSFYTVLLFGLAHATKKKFLNDQNNDNNISALEISSVKVLVAILYALGVIAIGVTGLIIPFNVFYCEYSYGYYDDDYYQTVVHTDVSSLPLDVQDWYNNLSYNIIHVSFAYLSTGTLLYRGTDGSHRTNYGTVVNRLWKLSKNSSQPELLSNLYEPDEFTLMSNDTVCFVASRRANITRRTLLSKVSPSKDSTSPHDYDYDVEEDTVACSDGESVRVAEEIYENGSHLHAGADGMLWFTANNWYYYNSDYIVFSLNPETMEVANHTTIINKNEGGADDVPYSGKCDTEYVRVQRARYAILVSILPALFTSLLLWKKLAIETMPVILYVGFSALTTSLAIALDPTVSDLDVILKWWFGITSALWLLWLFLQYLTNRIKQSTLGWCICFDAVVFFISMTVLIGVPGQYDDWWRWVLVNFVSYVPLIFIGLVTEYVLLMIFGAVGIFIDVFRIGQALVDATGGNGDILIFFSLFSVAGLAIGYLGWVLNQHQKSIQNAVRQWAGRYLYFMMREQDVMGGRIGVTASRNNEDDTVANTVANEEIETGIEISELELTVERPID